MWSSQAFNQWALQPAMFNDVPHEQIDWAALAKQWIQMQHTPPGEEGPPGSSNLPLPHGLPNMPDKFPTENLNKPLLKTPVAPDSYQHMAPEAEIPFIESEAFMQKPPEESYWNKGNWEGRPNNIVDERLWSAPPPPPPPSTAPSLPSMLPGKTTFDYGHMHDNPPLAMQTVDYNHVSDYNYSPMYAPPEHHYDQYWSQVNVAPPPISPMFLKKERVSSSLHTEEDTSHIDAAKRKQLPAWIREGLEKMEQERLKRLEKEKADKEAAEKLSKTSSMKKMSSLLKAEDSSVVMPTKSKFESDSDMEDESAPTLAKEIEKRRDTSSPIEDTRTEEEKKQELMLKVRRMLTEVLLSVTNAEILSVAQEVYRKAVSRAPARQLASTTSLTRVASGLCGLASYGSESEASSAEEAEQSDSDDDLFQRIKEKRRQFAIKEKRIIAELERQELEELEEAERIKREIFTRNSNKEAQRDDDVNNSEAAISNSPKIPAMSDDPVSNSEDVPVEVNTSAPQTNETVNKETESNSTESDSDSSSSSSSSNDDSGTNHKSDKKKARSSKNNKKEYKNKNARRKSSSSSKDERKRKRSRSRESENSNRHSEGSRSRGRHKSSSSKKSKRSESSSSSSSSNTHRNYSSKSHNHRKRERSHSYERSKKRGRSRSNSSSRHHSSRSRSHKLSYSRHDREKYAKRSREEKRHRHSQSPPRQSSRLPKKYRTSRSPSSENESLGKKLKTKSRNR